MKSFALFFLLHMSFTGFSQSSNFRAQGKYYSAKERYESGNYSSAIQFVNESKELLSGSNYQLQYLHVLSAYNLGKYKEAQNQMSRYFNLLDGVEERKRFSKGVDELTSDETKELTKLIDEIDFHVTNKTEEKLVLAKNAKEAEREAERKEKERIRCIIAAFDPVSYAHYLSDFGLVTENRHFNASPSNEGLILTMTVRGNDLFDGGISSYDRKIKIDENIVWKIDKGEASPGKRTDYQITKTNYQLTINEYFWLVDNNRANLTKVVDNLKTCFSKFEY